MELKLIDGKVIEVEQGKSGYDVAMSISTSLAKACVAYKVNDVIYDLHREIPNGGDFTLIKKGDPDSYTVLNHSTSHLMAEAIHNLYPNAKFGFGPSIEEGFYYDVDFGDEKITDANFAAIEKEMKRLSASGNPFVRKVVSKEEALEMFKDNPYKVELIEGIEGDISIYSQGKFFDLCAGPHLEKVSQIQNVKLLSVAGAYWRGDVKNKMLTRIYGTSWWTPEELAKHLQDLEDRKARDHRKLGKELGLFMLSDFGPGLPFWLPNGYTLRRTLEDFWLDYHRKNGYKVINTPIMLNRQLWETSGHWDHYKDDMFTIECEEGTYAIKPMNCPGAILVYNNELHSYKELPLRYAELGNVHRYEASGALNGLFRVRGFTQDDAHTLLTEEQIGDEVARIIAIYDHIYSIFGLNYAIELSTRPEGFIGDIETWNKAEEDLKKACLATGHPFKINPGDGAFYGPKLDFKLRDSMNRIWQCGTVQLDMQLPGRFNCEYVAADGSKKTPVMIHRACFGSIERFIAIILESFGGLLPLWLAPEQIRILPVNNNFHLDYAKNLREELVNLGYRAELDDSNEKLGFRMRNAQVKKINYTLVIGDNEVANNLVTFRRHGTRDQITVSKDEFLALIKEEVATKALPKK
ncbi:MAG: threonine--tRNA ligase [Bacilli bacterium]|nr:threonine--tRNA ligase [Bacilli bacterium]